MPVSSPRQGSNRLMARTGCRKAAPTPGPGPPGQSLFRSSLSPGGCPGKEGSSLKRCRQQKDCMQWTPEEQAAIREHAAVLGISTQDCICQSAASRALDWQ